MHRFRFFKLNQNVLFAGTVITSEINLNELEEFKKRSGHYIKNDWERVRMIFNKDEYETLHPVLLEVKDMAYVGCLVGTILGGFTYYLKYVEDFKYNTDTALYLNKKHANKMLVRYSLLGCTKGIMKCAPFTTLFLGGFTFFSLCFQTYRNKYGVLEYTFGGSTTGALFRINYGLRGMFAGGVIGGILGTIFGAATYLLPKLLGFDLLEYKSMQYAQIKNK